MQQKSLDINELTEKQFLDNYNSNEFEKPSVTVDTLIFTVGNKKSEDIRRLDEKELKILLVKRKAHPYKGQWSFPGGFVDVNESLEEAASRMLNEKTNISNVYLEQLYTYGEVRRDPRMRVLSVAYMALVPEENITLSVGRDITDIGWFIIKEEKDESGNTLIKLNNEKNKISIVYHLSKHQVRRGIAIQDEMSISGEALTKEKLAFDHAEILVDALSRMRNKVEFTPIAFNLVGELFTRSEIQNVYELLLGKKITRIEMWRKIKDMVIETDLSLSEKGHRPAKYYKFKEEWTYRY